MKTEPITIAFLGIDERSKSAYQLFFENIPHVQYELIDDYKKAQLCLIDKDSYKVQQQYEDIVKNHSEKHVLVLSILKHSCVHNKELFLQKPIKREALQERLNQMCCLISGKAIDTPNVPSRSQIKDTVRKISEKYRKRPAAVKCEEPVKPVATKVDNTVVSINKSPKATTCNAEQLLKIENEEYFVGTRADIDINDPQQLDGIFYSPGKLLQTVMEQAREKSLQNEQVVQLDVMEHVLYFDAKNQKIYSTVGASVIRHLCVVNQVEELTYHITPVTFDEDLDLTAQTRDNSQSQSCHSWRMEAFIWLIALWCSRGRIPTGTELAQPVYLMQWPNLTRLKSIPHATRIAALIYDQPRTLIDIARQLKIQQRYVFAFFSACKSIGVSDVSVRDIDRLFELEKPGRSKNQSILSKLLGRLIHISDETGTNKMAATAE